MNRLRKLTLVFGTVGIALGAGHLVQQREAMASPVAVLTTSVVQVSSGPKPTPEMAPDPLRLAALTEVPAAPIAPPMAEPAPCVTDLTLTALPGGTLSVWLRAPCAPDTRVELLHDGLRVAYATLPSGNLFTTLPALSDVAVVSARMPDGTVIAATATVPDAAVRRLAVQWPGGDGFALVASGDAAPVMLGDPAVADPRVALVSTLTASAALPGFEATVTAATCGRDVTAQILRQDGMEVSVNDLTLSMPPCEALGDILVLNNLLADVTLAAR